MYVFNIHKSCDFIIVRLGRILFARLSFTKLLFVLYILSYFDHRGPPRGFGDSGRMAIYFQGYGEEGHLFSGIWGVLGVLVSRKQRAEEKHFRDLGRKVIFLSGSREQRPPWWGLTIVDLIFLIEGSSCRIKGDPHEHTLDGVSFTYSGVCWYDILYISSNVYVRGHYELCRHHRSCVDEIEIHYNGNSISFLKGNTVKVGGTEVTSFPHTTLDGLIEISELSSVPHSDYKYEVMLPNAINVRFGGGHRTSVAVDVGMAFYGATKGK